MEPVEVVSKALRILECFTEDRPEMSLSEITRILEIPKTTVFRLVNTLQTNGYLELKEMTKRYTLGKMVSLLAANCLNQLDIRKIALPVMERIRNVTGETVYLNILEGSQRVIVDYSMGTNDLIYLPRLGRRNPLHAGASAKAILAFLSNDKIEEAILKEGLKRFTPQTITSLPELKKQIIQIRKQKYAFSIQEREKEIAAVSCPISNYQGIVGSISIGFPVSRLGPIDEFVGLIKEGAAEISAKLGGDTIYFYPENCQF